MKNGIFLIVIVGFVIHSCGTRSSSQMEHQIAGTYAREYTIKVIHAETGAEVGTRTIRDTIFIKPIGDKFQVSNRKWSMNDYDNAGWRDMKHSEDRPKPTYLSSYSSKDGSLIGDNGLELYLDNGNRSAFWNVEFKYERVND